ncbi:hypothetical protein ACJMK2_041984 [Sinanodonta woodiana]|uniref:SOCS box domain-containing protein n=1 Tax=Sinanodonta woodiana TaxID=1069815 RepID=A0ABD3W6L2_SINWO
MLFENEDAYLSDDEDPPSDEGNLMHAIRNHSVDIIKDLILNKGLSPNFVYHRKNPVCVAASVGFIDVLDILVEGDCFLDVQDLSDPMWKRYPLHIAASNGHLQFVKRLIEFGAEVNCCDSDKRTALHWCATHGHHELAKYLISVGAVVNAAQIDGFTPLHAATCLGHVAVCEVLLFHGADVNLTDSDGWTALHTAVCYGHIDVVQTLLNARASFTKKTTDEETAFLITASCGHLNILKLLIEKGAKINDKNITGHTALHLAVHHNKFDIAKYLIQINADMNTTNQAGQSPFYLSALRAEETLMHMIINSGYNLSREEWILSRKYPTAISKNVSLCDWLHHMATNCRTLKDLCCYKIRQVLGMNYSKHVHSLPLPTLLKEFINTSFQ